MKDWWTNPGEISIKALDLGETDEFTATEIVPYLSGPLDYFRAVVNVFHKKKLMDTDIGISCQVHLTISLKLGLSSSAVILVSWATFTGEAMNLQLSREDIGYYSFLAEHYELGIPCGMMDQWLVR